MYQQRLLIGVQLSGVADSVVGLVTAPASVFVDAKVWSIFEL
jgi:gas vesicle protein